MKKILVLFLVVLFGFAVSNVYAAGDSSGTYTLDSVTIAPPAGTVWDGSNPAMLEVGTTYTVDMTVMYDGDISDAEPYYSTLTAGLTFDDSGSYFSQSVGATNVDVSYSSIGNALYHSAQYDFNFEIQATEAMLDDTMANAVFGNGNDEVLTAALPVDVNMVPEPATLVLLGFGLLGIAGVSRRKNLG